MKLSTSSVIGAIAGASAAPSSSPSPCVSVPSTPLRSAYQPLEHFTSYSIEFSSFADFAGNLSSPNKYSDNLLNNIAYYAGSKPLVRVGGNTQDLTIFNATQQLAVIQQFSTENPDYPANETIGPAFFESYQTWPGVRFSHGFNLAENSTEARKALLDSVPYACKALRGKFNGWELGNEPDLFWLPISGTAARGSNYNQADYVAEWLYWARAIRSKMQKTCPDLTNDATFKFFAPSLAGSASISKFDTAQVFAAGLNADKDIKYIAQHKYIAAGGDAGITQQGTLMNHTNNILAVNQLLNVSASIQATSGRNLIPNAPYILGEGNSLARQGIGGVSNSFGAALWGLDYGLLLVSNGIGRWHMHQGVNYRYQAWQPIETHNTTKGTKAPYYSNIAVSAFLGNLTNAEQRPQVVDLELPQSDESAYASYVQGRLSKIIVINMSEYNATASNLGYINAYARPVETYSFQLPCSIKGAHLQRLLANGSDSITGVTFDGFSYAAELNNGKPVRLPNITTGEYIKVGRDGKATVQLLRSSAVILNFT
ncbi:hypothetical protein EJ02DRAFT_513905 [Clathrospora elynae]|uniref:Beta-glucuronidase C-terminal domain-containing protein n=1 Tax=Clathrospora elynae TaxID=706981 RepID=A0A6A5SI36_9PLEO|nr:hypothetical protein EJ02DRAFT_513905 [Clathrospora elynae]